MLSVTAHHLWLELDRFTGRASAGVFLLQSVQVSAVVRGYSAAS
jgi:hypothetical protein